MAIKQNIGPVTLPTENILSVNPIVKKHVKELKVINITVLYFLLIAYFRILSAF